MKIKYGKQNLSVRTLGIFLLGVLFISGINLTVPGTAVAQTTSAIETDYIVQLRQNDPAILESVGSAVTPRLSFSRDPDLKFVYSFHSTRSLLELQTFLAPNF